MKRVDNSQMKSASNGQIHIMSKYEYECVSAKDPIREIRFVWASQKMIKEASQSSIHYAVVANLHCLHSYHPHMSIISPPICIDFNQSFIVFRISTFDRSIGPKKRLWFVVDRKKHGPKGHGRTGNCKYVASLSLCRPFAFGMWLWQFRIENIVQEECERASGKSFGASSSVARPPFTSTIRIDTFLPNIFPCCLCYIHILVFFYFTSIQPPRRVNWHKYIRREDSSLPGKFAHTSHHITATHPI